MPILPRSGRHWAPVGWHRSKYLWLPAEFAKWAIGHRVWNWIVTGSSCRMFPTIGAAVWMPIYIWTIITLGNWNEVESLLCFLASGRAIVDLVMRPHLGPWRQLHASTCYVSLWIAERLQYGCILARSVACSRRIWVGSITSPLATVWTDDEPRSYVQTTPVVWRFYMDHLKSRRLRCVLCSDHYNVGASLIVTPASPLSCLLFFGNKTSYYHSLLPTWPVSQIYKRDCAHNQQCRSSLPLVVIFPTETPTLGWIFLYIIYRGNLWAILYAVPCVQRCEVWGKISI
jgi:hypothetical protein